MLTSSASNVSHFWPMVPRRASELWRNFGSLNHVEKNVIEGVAETSESYNFERLVYLF